MKNASRGYSTDMSPAALEKRLRIVSELRDFTLHLATAKPLERPEAAAPAASGVVSEESPLYGNRPA